MKTFKTVVFVLLLAFFLTVVILIINLDVENFDQVLENKEIVKFSAIAAFLLFLLYAVMNYFSISRRDRKINKLEREKNEIKAKFYDIKEEEERIDKSMKSFGKSLPKKDTSEDDPNQKE